MKKQVYVLTVIMLSFLLILGGCGSDFDAAGYVQAFLDERLQGEFEASADIMDQSGYELKQDYEAAVNNFVYTYLTAGYEELNDYTLYEYRTLVKEIFSVMKYDVKKAQKTGKKEYEVAVKIQPVDLFVNYVKDLKAASEEIEGAAENGGYEGTEEEIREMMQNDYLARAYDLLQDSYLNMKYLDPVTVKIKVSAEKGKDFSVRESEYQLFLKKLFQMDQTGLEEKKS